MLSLANLSFSFLLTPLILRFLLHKPIRSPKHPLKSNLLFGQWYFTGLIHMTCCRLVELRSLFLRYMLCVMSRSSSESLWDSRYSSILRYLVSSGTAFFGIVQFLLIRYKGLVKARRLRFYHSVHFMHSFDQFGWIGRCVSFWGYSPTNIDFWFPCGVLLINGSRVMHHRFVSILGSLTAAQLPFSPAFSFVVFFLFYLGGFLILTLVVCLCTL